MANETIRATLSQMLTRYAAQRANILGRMQDCRGFLFNAESNLKQAREAERRAVFEDDELTRKMRELMVYYNSLPIDPPRPQALLEEHAEIGREQVQTHRKRMAAHEAVRNATSVWEDAKRDLAVAEQDEKTVSERIRETNEQIGRLNQQP